MVGEDKYVVAGVCHSKGDREVGVTKTGGQFIKTEEGVKMDGIGFSTSMPGLIDVTEPINYVPVVKESKSTEKEVAQNEPKKKCRFKPIKKKQWKPFDSLDIKLYEKKNNKTWSSVSNSSFK